LKFWFSVYGGLVLYVRSLLPFVPLMNGNNFLGIRRLSDGSRGFGSDSYSVCLLSADIYISFEVFWNIRRVTDLGLSADGYEFVGKMAGDLKGLAGAMRNTLYLAVGISPLVVIHPKKLDLDGIRRDYLIAVC
jgi:hypothetical protein